MGTIIQPGDRMTTLSGRPSWLARSSVPLSNYFGGGSVNLTAQGSISYANLYETQIWVAVNVNKLTRQISRLPLKVYQRDTNGDRERVQDGPLVDLLRRPWARGGPIQLKQAFAFPMLLHGNSVVAKVRSSPGAPPSSFVPLDWRFLTPHKQETGPVEFWQYGEKFYAPEDVVHLGWRGPDGEIGTSPLKQLGTTIRTEDSAQRYTHSSFDNGVRPSVAITLPPESRPDTQERQLIRDEIQQDEAGVDSAFKAMVLGGGATVETMSHTAHEAELIEVRKVGEREVAALYDNPQPMVGNLEKATYSNIAEQFKAYFGTNLGPWLTLYEESFQAQLIDPEPAFTGLFCEFDLSEVLKGTPREEGQGLRDLVQSGLMTLNEARQVLNRRRYDEPAADVPLMPTNNMGPIAAVAAVPEQTPPKATTVEEHLARWADLTRRKRLAGLVGWDRERFVAELKTDLPEVDADALADRIEERLQNVNGDPDRVPAAFDLD